MTELILACTLWLIATLGDALADSIKQSRAALHQDKLWHFAKWGIHIIPRSLCGIFARPVIVEWLNWEWWDLIHYTYNMAILGTVIFLCIPLHWWVRMSLKKYWDDKYETKW